MVLKTPAPLLSMASMLSTEPTLWLYGGDPSTGVPLGSAWLRTHPTHRHLPAPAVELSATCTKIELISDWLELERVCRSSKASDVVIAFPISPTRLQELAAMADRCGCRFHVAVSHEIESETGWPEIGAVVKRVVLDAPNDAHAAPTSGAFSRLRRAVDIIVALTLAVVTLPLVLAAAAAVSIESRSAPLFVQTRIGRYGHPFRLFKIRTMHRSAAPFAPSPADGDPHVTRVGRLLRGTGFDEIPQLLNVLRGEMTLVGPRPEMPFIVERYTPLQRERLAVRPGLTGFWQLRGDRHVAIHDQIEYDFYYIAFRSPALDARLFAETVMFAVRGGVRALRRSSAASQTDRTRGSENLTSVTRTASGE